MIQFIKEALSDDNRIISSSRIAFLLWAIGILITWIVGSLKANELLDIPDGVLLVLAILMTGKVTQRFSERKTKE